MIRFRTLFASLPRFVGDFPTERPPVRREPPPIDEKILLEILREEGIKASWLIRISPKYDIQRFRRTARLFYARIPESRINGPSGTPEAKRYADQIVARANRDTA